MEIYISEEDILESIQEKFHKAYPYLRLEFFRNPHEAGQGSPGSEKLPPETPIDDIRMQHAFGWMDIGKKRTVAQLEVEFYRRFGLSVQVLRKSGPLWLQTTFTDTLTLKEQNEMGRSSTVSSQ